MTKLLVLFLFVWSGLVTAQSPTSERLEQQLTTAPTDTARVNRLLDLSEAAGEGYIVALEYSEQALKLAEEIHDESSVARAKLALGTAFSHLNNYQKATHYLNEARAGFSKQGDSLGVARVISRLSWVNTQRGDYATAFGGAQEGLRLAKKYRNEPLIRQNMSSLSALHTYLGDYDIALDYTTSVMDEYDQAKDLKNVCRTLNGLGELYRIQGNPERAENYYTKAIKMAESLQSSSLKAQAESNLAAVQVDLGDYQTAMATAHRALRVLLARGAYEVIAWTQTVMARAQLGANRPDSAIFYGRQSWNLSRQIGNRDVARDASTVLTQAYARQDDFRQAYQFQRASIAYNDTLSGARVRQQLTILQQNADDVEKQAALAVQTEENRRRQVLLYFMLGGLITLLIVAYALFVNNRRKQRTNALLQQQRDQISQALSDLKSTQNQLVQREKLASLGELTAGIAHEIQNPLNFVNNFAEVSVELLDELADEQQKPDRDPELEADLLSDLRQNLQKISQHGGRASSIVRGMLQHSRASTGQREPTDLNALAEEYLRLAYHGLRAKDKTFNATLKTDFDSLVPSLNVDRQDISRVLLNLFTNAFYTVNQRQKQAQVSDRAYQPAVTVQTRHQPQQVEIQISDNGTGIPKPAMAKIFQPFFTTKPTGEGTGLGLSLAYDIITKGHNGTLTVTSQEGQGTTFVITLPA